MKKQFFACLFLGLTAVLFPQNISLFQSYEIPSFSFYSLQFSAQDLFSFTKSIDLESPTGRRSDYTRTGGRLIADYYKQSPEFTSKLTGMFEYGYAFERSSITDILPSGEKIRVPHSARASAGTLSVKSENKWYPEGRREWFCFADPAIYLNEDLVNDTKFRVGQISLGGGYGRMVGVRYAAQAKMLCDELHVPLSEADILKLAEMIERYSKGYYLTNYRDDEKIAFYKDVIAFIAKPDAAFKIDQIFSSGLYKYIQRHYGWESSIGITYATSNRDKYSGTFYSMDYHGIDETDFTARFAWGIPFEINQQFQLTAQYSKNLSGSDREGRFERASLEVSYAFQHTFNWVSSVYGNLFAVFPKNSGMRHIAGLKIQTDLILLNWMSLYGAISYAKKEIAGGHVLIWTPVFYNNSAEETYSAYVGLRIFIY